MGLEVKYTFFEDKFTKYEDSLVHINTHAIHYGSSIFEGIRFYNVGGEPKIYRLEEHITRLVKGAKVYSYNINYSVEEIMNICQELVIKNNLKSGYIRPIIYKGYKQLGLYGKNVPTQLAVTCWNWGKYLGDDSEKLGIKIMTSSWTRIANNTIPNQIKAGGQYMSSQLIKTEAIDHGYDEGIALNSSGLISEGSGENIFVIRDGIVYTPSISQSVLIGITRDTVIKICEHLNIKLIETGITREFAYYADEIFLSGTAAEITPVCKYDNIEYNVGNITISILNEFNKIINNESKMNKKYPHWLK